MLKLNMKQNKNKDYRLPIKCNLIITCYMKLMHLYVHMYMFNYCVFYSKMKSYLNLGMGES